MLPNRKLKPVKRRSEKKFPAKPAAIRAISSRNDLPLYVRRRPCSPMTVSPGALPSEPSIYNTLYAL